MPTLLLFSEKKIREKFGLSAPAFRDLREQLQLQELSEWVRLRGQGRGIALTAGGLGRIVDHIRSTSAEAVMPVTFQDCVLTSESNGQHPPKPDPEIEEVTVLQVYPNRHLLKCQRASGQIVDVWVKNNRKFVRRMPVQCTASGPGGRLEHFGRCPRKRGKY